MKRFRFTSKLLRQFAHLCQDFNLQPSRYDANTLVLKHHGFSLWLRDAGDGQIKIFYPLNERSISWVFSPVDETDLYYKMIVNKVFEPEVVRVVMRRESKPKYQFTKPV